MQDDELNVKYWPDMVKDILWGWSLPGLIDLNHKRYFSFVFWLSITLIWQVIISISIFNDILGKLIFSLILFQPLMITLLRIIYMYRKYGYLVKIYDNNSLFIKKLVFNMLFPGWGLLNSKHKILGMFFGLVALLCLLTKRWGLYHIPAIISSFMLLKIVYPNLFKANRLCLIRTHLSAIMILILLSSFLYINSLLLAEYSVIVSGSMQPNINVGDTVLVNKYAYLNRKPKAGDIILFKRPDTKEDAIKRVVGLPGSVISFSNGEFYCDGELIDIVGVGKVPESINNPYFNYGYRKPYTVPDDSVFILGDNRIHSLDSRYWGAIPMELVKGRVMYWYSPGKTMDSKWQVQ